MKFIELFSGIGGFRYGLEMCNRQHAGECCKGEENLSSHNGGNGKGWRSNTFTCIFANDNNKYACQVYRKNFGGEELHEGDITKIIADDIPDFDLLCGGFPCQAFSIAGKRKGFEDTRGTLFFDIARIAKHHQPMFMLLENVKGLISHDDGKTLETILDTLQSLGYYVNYEIYNSKDYGAPQNRERVFFLCRHIKGLVDDGWNQKMNLSKTIIQEWLFQILLNNLDEVQRLQGQRSKDLILGYLLCQEISQSLKLKGENILDGIMIPMGENISLFEGKDPWLNIDTWLRKNSVGNLQELNKSTISTEIKKIIESKTYTYFQMFHAMLLATVSLKKSSNLSWKEVLSDLILIKENTKYARINNREKEAVITESSTLHITQNLEDFKTNFIIGHTRGECRPEVFPIRQNGSQINDLQGQVANTLTARYEPAQATGTYIGENKLNAQVLAWSKSHRTGKSEMDKRRKNYGEIEQRIKIGEFNTLSTGDGCGNQSTQNFINKGTEIRRLTPTECERLQGFPDDWCKGISDSQAYKCYGNAVTTTVIKEIGKRLINTLHL